MEPLISVIVPVYRSEKYLARCVESILGQTYGNWELVLVDDGSPDDCPALCEAYKTRDKRVKVIHKQNGGLMSAWMAGVKESCGAYLNFLDSDDWVETDMLETMRGSLAGVPGEVVCGNYLIEKPGKSTPCFHRLSPGCYEGERLESEVKERLLGNETRTVSFSRCMKLFSRELIVNNMKYCNPKIRMGEDVNIVLPALIDSSRLVILEGALHYHYFYNEASMVHKYDAKMYEGIKELYGTIRMILSQKPLPGWEAQAEKEYYYLLMLAVKNELRGGPAGYARRIGALCTAEGVKELARRYQLRPQAAAERIVSWVMARPGLVRAAAARGIFRAYDALGR